MKHILKKGHAIIITGPEGCGKTSLAKVIAESCGSYAMVQMTDIFMSSFPDHNALKKDTVIVDDFNPNFIASAKNLISVDTIHVNRKCRDPEQVATPNFIFCTGSLDALKLDMDDRRFTVINMDR